MPVVTILRTNKILNDQSKPIFVSTADRMGTNMSPPTQPPHETIPSASDLFFSNHIDVSVNEQLMTSAAPNPNITPCVKTSCQT
ncbi:hypothetical protein AX774_g1555 [Zancudomyces culisetae]|uniref:Uncharacterized protein n=1 Tax=Zancudomyces culisetae TaxID=1213189 RepID=A0A1R1PVA7_ZANCU|nr:hypothetical protein AX774_g1555 [Zancudomyces culisetae]|eukprot:OMH84900.1 hypothetical protein AX774_g1555 [Zancudomyces culisetae]